MPCSDAALGLAELHDRADVVGRAQDRRAYDGLAHLGDLAAVGVLAGVGDLDDLAVLHDDLVDHVGRRRDQVQVELALEPLADDLHVQQAEEAAPETEAEGAGGLRLVRQRRVVQLQPLEGVAQVRVVVAVDGVEPGVDHRVRVLVAGQRLGRAVVLAGHGVTDPRLADVLHAGDQVADLADPEVLRLHRLRADHADLEHLVHHAVGHHLDAVAVAQLAVDDADVGDHAAVGVVDRVEDQGPRRGVRVTDRRRRLLDDLVEQRLDPVPGLGRGEQHVGDVAPDDVRKLGGVLLGLGRGQVDLVQHRDDVEVGAEGEVQVCQGLRLDPLSRVDQQHGRLAGLEAAGHLVGEVHVPRCVDHVEHVRARLGALVVAGRDGPRHPDGLALDGDAALALDVHAVEVLRAGAALVDHPRQLQHPVRQRRLAVVDVGDDAEVAEHPRVGRAGERRGGRDGRGHGPFSQTGPGRTKRWEPHSGVPTVSGVVWFPGASSQPRKLGPSALRTGCPGCRRRAAAAAPGADDPVTLDVVVVGLDVAAHPVGPNAVALDVVVVGLDVAAHPVGLDAVALDVVVVARLHEGDLVALDVVVVDLVPLPCGTSVALDVVVARCRRRLVRDDLCGPRRRRRRCRAPGRPCGPRRRRSRRCCPGR